MKAAYNKFFDKQTVAQVPVAAARGGLGKKFTVFDQKASGVVQVPDPQ